MTEKDQVYRCNVCGNVVKVVQNGAGELVCCGQPMQLEIEEGTMAATPVVETMAAETPVSTTPVAEVAIEEPTISGEMSSPEEPKSQF